MFGFGCLAIGILIYVVPINELRGYSKYEGNEEVLKGPKIRKKVLAIVLMTYGLIRWLLIILNYRQLNP